jgi:hypothetical protein
VCCRYFRPKRYKAKGPLIISPGGRGIVKMKKVILCVLPLAAQAGGIALQLTKTANSGRIKKLTMESFRIKITLEDSTKSREVYYV